MVRVEEIGKEGKAEGIDAYNSNDSEEQEEEGIEDLLKLLPSSNPYRLPLDFYNLNKNNKEKEKEKEKKNKNKKNKKKKARIKNGEDESF